MDQGNEPATLAEAGGSSTAAGPDVDGLRARIKRGQVTTRRGNDGRLLVSVAANGAEP